MLNTKWLLAKDELFHHQLLHISFTEEISLSWDSKIPVLLIPLRKQGILSLESTCFIGP